MDRPILRICMLNADTPVPTVHPHYPTYGAIFHSLLSKASPETTLLSTDFNVTQFEYPDSLDVFDAVIVSGSANSAYEDIPWIKKLNVWIKDVYVNNPDVKIFGSCFGHQVICQSLLGEHGARVEQDVQGWEIGVKSIDLQHGFRQRFGLDEVMRLQFVHHDHVVLGELPGNWMTVGRTQHCAVQGVYEPGRVLTLQGHFEFDRSVNGECIKYFFGNEWDEERLRKALECIEKDDDAVVAARKIVRFLLGEDETRQNERYELVGHGGLLTPPAEE